MVDLKRCARGCIGIAVSLLLTGVDACGDPQKPRLPVVSRPLTSKKFAIQIVVAGEANQDSPIPMDFVAVTDRKLLLEVAKLSAKDWFDRRMQVARDFGEKVQVISWEWVPGEHAGPISIDLASGTLGAFLFANYSNAGDHRAAVDVRIPVVVTLGAEEFSMQQLK
jgi:type VI secretion system protein